MPVITNPITTDDLTSANTTTGTTSIGGTGVLDRLMSAFDEHISREYNRSRITGSDYSTVYLGGMQAVLAQSVEFLLRRDKSDLENQLIAAQIEKIQHEILLIDAQKCKVDAEFDLLVQQKLKTIEETALVAQKKLTEQAQTDFTNVDPNSIVGKQAALYGAQADGFQRDAEQKAAKILVDTWNVRRTTDDTYPSIGTGVEDANVLKAVQAMFAGIGIVI